MTTYYHQHIDDCLDDEIKDKIDEYCAQLKSAQEEFAANKDHNIAAIIDSCRKNDDLPEIIKIAEEIRARYLNVVVCGFGGSGLSGKMLAHLRLHHFMRSPALHILDTVDPELIEAIIANCPAKDSFVIIVSKSGKTVETLSQFYTLFAQFSKILGAEAAKHFLIITENSENPLRLSAQKYNIRLIDHPNNIGGRFSLFTIVGLLPACLAGLDIARLRNGAASVADELGIDKPHPALIGAAIQVAHMKQGRNMSVMFLYSERLKGLSAWYRQSWAESLGKNGNGSTPIPAIGTTDQHSQLQLYLDGPDDKLFTLITQPRAGSGQEICPPDFADLSYLKGRKTGDIMESEQRATLETLIAHKRPVRLIKLESLDESSLGALIMHFTLEIAFSARLLNINAFNQPAVEESKRRARHYLTISQSESQSENKTDNLQ